ncbi:MAG TPA: hypothetical protein VMW27_15165 [Thermoanaerobaculia bacterium]|nr:hypothetical protein [Thermoanaerobaculia bacterium]
MRIRNGGGSFSAEATAAVNEWNSRTILNISSVSSGEETYYFSANSGATGWGGLARITNYSGCTILRATAQLNTYYSWTSNAARGVQCQEVGHTFGLDHSNDGGCMGGGYWYDIGTHYTLVTGNINEIGSIYANKHDDHPTVGPEAGEPVLHANWYHHPRSIRQATRLASDIVVATVDYVTDGDPIVLPAESGGNIPTQRVHFTVKRSRKGSMVASESFVLFQNGNDHNRFEDDPTYKVGQRYLLFLTPRPDGSYLVLSPEGRYEVGAKGLVPAIDEGFAAGLAGASLSDVLADVTTALVQTPDPQ